MVAVACTASFDSQPLRNSTASTPTQRSAAISGAARAPAPDPPDATIWMRPEVNAAAVGSVPSRGIGPMRFRVPVE